MQTISKSVSIFELQEECLNKYLKPTDNKTKDIKPVQLNIEVQMYGSEIQTLKFLLHHIGRQVIDYEFLHIMFYSLVEDLILASEKIKFQEIKIKQLNAKCCSCTANTIKIYKTEKNQEKALIKHLKK